MKQVMLNLGCGAHVVKDFINIDKYLTLENLKSKKGIYEKAIVDKGGKFIQADMLKLPFKDNSVDYIECNDAVEHLPIGDVPFFFKEIYRVLKRKHNVSILTPNFAGLAKLFLDNCDREDFNTEAFFALSNYIYGNQVHEGEFHRSALTPWYIQRLAQTIGFSNIEIVLYPRNTPMSKGPQLKTLKWTGPLAKTFFAYDYIHATLTK
jgi:SAM-dependent methyltransferase